jgi:hypothetical protein
MGLFDILKRYSKHNVFISFHHELDQDYKDKFEILFGDLFNNKSVNDNEIDENLSTEYIKRLIRENHITASSVCVVLIGKETYKRKHVDWEIYAALDKKVGGYSGLLGILLPTHPDSKRNEYNPGLIPPRLVDNIKSGYAIIYDWTYKENEIKKWIEIAFNDRIEKADKIDNSRIQYKNNL